MLTKDLILAARDLDSEVVTVPEWGGDVRISVMGGAAREAFFGRVVTGMRNSEFFALVLASTLIDEDGNLLFTAEEMTGLHAKNPDVLGRLAEVAIRLNKLGKAAVGDAEKNSEASQSDDSGTGSPSNSE